ncbi:uncharacterized protein MELLADRAFT_62210 [Melampsora larici-populina 98AG31]|uniref:Uncharacterized protein n=1 Tax=Melampsora larici-populina (strain 98AG31 / pathotype 3-4-7) TaxID=747676 RepID=F4RI06_MELLP|nr:uncharacterized protein MELLADRAFT_62210 [Melampsora larici-populina 98AG31]EGG07913.1 hypothetical protein MELLADRAFT_62210 [Melampsora larici-populina 98AG31]
MVYHLDRHTFCTKYFNLMLIYFSYPSFDFHHQHIISVNQDFHHRSMGHDRFQKRSKKVLGVIMMKPSEQNLTANGVTVLAPVSSVDKAVLKSQGSQESSQDMSMAFKNDFNSSENKTNLSQKHAVNYTADFNQSVYLLSFWSSSNNFLRFGLTEPTSYTNSSDTSASVESDTTSGLSVVPENSLKNSKLSKTMDIAPVNASAGELFPFPISFKDEEINLSSFLFHLAADHLTNSKKPETHNQKQELTKNEPSTNENTEANKTPTGSILDQKQGNNSKINDTQSQSNGNQTKPVDDWQYLVEF